MYMRKTSRLLAIFVWAGVCMMSGAYADSITVNGKTYSDVIVRESGTRYYVATPSDGKAFSVAKADVATGSIAILSGAQREALQREWEFQAGYAQRAAVAQRAAIDKTQPAQTKEGPVRIVAPPPEARGDDPAYASAAMVHELKQTSVPERSNATDGPGAPMWTRLYAITAASDTLPKIIVRNAGGPAGGSFGGGTGGMGGGGFGGGVGQGGFAGGGFGGGAGGFGGAGMGGGAFGGGGGFGGPQISNISQLFSTIDDRLVGETPAVIGMSISGGPTPTR